MLDEESRFGIVKVEWRKAIARWIQNARQTRHGGWARCLYVDDEERLERGKGIGLELSVLLAHLGESMHITKRHGESCERRAQDLWWAGPRRGERSGPITASTI